MSGDAAKTTLTLYEWQQVGPEQHPELAWAELGRADSTQQMNADRSIGKRLELSELRNGLQITTSSYVGRVCLGGLDIRILPKIRGECLLPLLRYVYGFRSLHLTTKANQGVNDSGFEDLLIYQLNAEVHDFIARGLLRSYVPKAERLGSPRGRLDMTRIALDGGTVTATLPCIHHPRTEDTVLNRVLLAGLNLAATMASDIELSRGSRRLAAQLKERVTAIRLENHVLDRAAERMNRLTTAYDSALAIIRLLFEASGVVLEGQSVETKLSGFLFDMNAFFQALISRFLRDNLREYNVRDEVSLKHMMKYNPEFNPQKRKPPTPRPDFVVSYQRETVSILDAKYRDLWLKPLPREMLYQLVVYAMSNRQQRRSGILYPTTNPYAKESRIDVTDPIDGTFLAQVCLRPVYLPKLVELIHTETPRGRREREAFAASMAIGYS